ncbi:MAG: hypothetical protein H6755_03865 [Candidatus Omnitrophica bacterium]|nr:hypothetical protein [Candidatus Omnitrophota bacterium]
MKIKKGKWNGVITVVMAVIFFVLWLYFIFKMYTTRSFNADELYQIEMTKGVFKPFWQHHYYGDHTSFPGEYLLTYPFVQIFGVHKWGLALPHAPFIILFFYFLFRLGKIYFQTFAGFFIMFLLVFHHQYFVYHALEFRPYAVLPALALGSFYFAQLIVNHFENLSTKKRILIGFYWMIAMNFHAYGILIVFLPLMFVILTAEHFDWKTMIRHQGLRYYLKYWILALIIWIWYASGNSFGWTANKMQSIRPAFQFVPHPLEHFYKFCDVIVRNCLGYKVFNFTLLAVPVAFYLALKQRIKMLLFFGLLIFLPITLIILVDVKTKYWFLARQIVWIMPFFIFFVAWAWDICLISGQRFITSFLNSKNKNI